MCLHSQLPQRGEKSSPPTTAVVVVMAGYGVTFLVLFVLFLWRGFPSLSCFGGHCLVLLVDNIVDFSLWRELLASCHGGSHCLRTVEEVMSLALWKKSLPLHPGGYHWPCAMEAGSHWPCTLEVAVALRYGGSHWICTLENCWLCCHLHGEALVWQLIDIYF